MGDMADEHAIAYFAGDYDPTEEAMADYDLTPEERHRLQRRRRQLAADRQAQELRSPNTIRTGVGPGALNDSALVRYECASCARVSILESQPKVCPYCAEAWEDDAYEVDVGLLHFEVEEIALLDIGAGRVQLALGMGMNHYAETLVRSRSLVGWDVDLDPSDSGTLCLRFDFSKKLSDPER